MRILATRSALEIMKQSPLHAERISRAGSQGVFGGVQITKDAAG